MTEKEEYIRRLDKQDETLAKLMEGQSAILQKMAEHRVEHEAIDPSVKELVGILKGMKFMKAATVLLASILGTFWVVWLWVKDHIHLKL